MRKLGIALYILSLAGCAYIDQNLRLTPQFTVLESNMGHGKKIALRVVDDRENQLIGRRRDGYGFAAAKISTEQDLTELLRGAFIEGLRKKGFMPVSDHDTDVLSLLKVELRTLSYDNSSGLWTGGNMGNAAVKVIASRASGKETYEKNYRSQKEIRTIFIGSQETNASVINGALSEVLEKVFSDTELWEFLAQ